MRKIKFRAWNRKINEMMYGVGVYDDMFICYMDYDEDDLYIQGDVELFPQDCQDFELMQYTGLKDSKGEEIYEGDIVQVVRQHDTQYAQVVWGDFSPCSQWDCAETWILRFSESKSHLREPAQGPLYPYCTFGGQDVLIIGNVYEHSELLEKKG